MPSSYDSLAALLILPMAGSHDEHIYILLFTLMFFFPPDVCHVHVTDKSKLGNSKRADFLSLSFCESTNHRRPHFDKSIHFTTPIRKLQANNNQKL